MKSDPQTFAVPSASAALSIRIEREDPRNPQAQDLLGESHALMRSLFPPEHNHFLEVAQLCAPNIRFFLARTEAGDALGCIALAQAEREGEVKSMFVAPQARGMGVAGRLLARLEQDAAAQGITTLRLETGDALQDAVRFYRCHGFTQCGPFGTYADNGTSLFFEKQLVESQ